MAVITSGISASDILTVDPKNKALRVTNRPIISSTLGSYQFAMVSGLMAAGLAAAAQVWNFRYAGAGLCLVEKVIFDGFGATTAFTPGPAIFRLRAARAFTATLTGGTAAVLTGNNAKLRTSYATTAVGGIGISTTAILAGASFTLDDQAVGGVVNYVGAVPANGVDEGVLFDSYQVGHPFVCANNEGLILQATVPAGGTWNFGITVKWTEVTAAEWEV